MNTEQEIESLLLKSEEIISQLPSHFLDGRKAIQGSSEILDELIEFMNKDGELVSEKQSFVQFDDSGGSGEVVLIVGSIVAVCRVLNSYLKTKNRKIVIQSGKKKLIVENYSEAQIKRLIRVFDRLKIEK